MEFPPEHYFQTATQRMRQARLLFEDGTSYALAIYVGGVAVECLLRALKGRRNPVFDERHDLLLLFSSSRMIHRERERLLRVRLAATRSLRSGARFRLENTLRFGNPPRRG